MQQGLIKPLYVSSKSQITDIFTKSLGKVPHCFLLIKLKVIVLTPPLTCGRGVEHNGIELNNVHQVKNSLQQLWATVKVPRVDVWR